MIASVVNNLPLSSATAVVAQAERDVFEAASNGTKKQIVDTGK